MTDRQLETALRAIVVERCPFMAAERAESVEVFVEVVDRLAKAAVGFSRVRSQPVCAIAAGTGSECSQ